MTKLKELNTPVFQAEPIPPYSLVDYRVKVTGLVEEEKAFSLAEIKAMPFSRTNARLTSVSGWSVRANWDGVQWKNFLQHLKIKPSASHVTFTSLGGYDTTVALSELENDRVMIVYGVDGELLEEEYGAPIRMIIPNLWGYKSCKQLEKIEFTDRMLGGFWEDRGYTRSGEIEAGITYDVNTKTDRQIKGGEITDF